MTLRRIPTSRTGKMISRLTKTLRTRKSGSQSAIMKKKKREKYRTASKEWQRTKLRRVRRTSTTRRTPTSWKMLPSTTSLE